MLSDQCWESFFGNWPSAIPRRGVLQTVLNEAMPFKNYWIKDGMLLIERATPDAMGARFVLLGFDVINLVKFTDPLTSAIITDAGFTEKASNKPPSRQPQLA